MRPTHLFLANVTMLSGLPGCALATCTPSSPVGTSTENRVADIIKVATLPATLARAAAEVSRPMRATITPLPTLEAPVFLTFSDPGMGDGAIDVYDELLRAGSVPDIVLYADGRLFAREEGWFGETKLSTAEMCDLRTRLILAGALQGSDPEFNGTPTPESGFGNGEPSVSIEISAEKGADQFGFTVLEEDYLTEAYKRPATLMREIHAQLSLAPYQADRFLLWLEEAGERPAEKQSLSWPEWESWQGLPSLQELLERRIQGMVEVRGEEALALSGQIQYRPTVHLFQEGEDRVVMIVRPLLPHESLAGVLSGQYGFVSPVPMSELPFSCKGP